MFCPACGLSCQPIDRELSLKWARGGYKDDDMDGTIEEWRCSNSRCIVQDGLYSVTHGGRRVGSSFRYPKKDKVILILEEERDQINEDGWVEWYGVDTCDAIMIAEEF